MNETATNRQIIAQAGAGRTDAHLIAVLQSQRCIQGRLQLLPFGGLHFDAGLSTGNRHNGLPLTGEGQAAHENFQTRRRRIVTHRAVGSAQGAAIQRARCGHTLPRPAGAAQVLKQGLQTWRLDLQIVFADRRRLRPGRCSNLHTGLRERTGILETHAVARLEQGGLVAAQIPQG